MEINILKCFEDVKENDILYGGNSNLTIQRNVYPYLDYRNKSAVEANKYLLLQFEFYIFHVCYCYERIVAGDTDSKLLLQGYTSYEIDTAYKAYEEYGNYWNTKMYLYMSTARIGMISRTIEKLNAGRSIQGIPTDIVESAKRRIKYANHQSLSIDLEGYTQ